MYCPYPNCEPGDNSSTEEQYWHIADEVYVCSRCGRLSYQCVVPACTALNRPYSYFCRKCGKCQFLKSAPITVSDRWHLVDQFDDTWKFRSDEPEANGRPHEVRSEGSATVAHLTENLNYTSRQAASSVIGERNPVLLESRFLDGLLAVHQGRESLTLLHPFRDLASSEGHRGRNLWSVSEGQLLTDAGYQFPQVEYDPQWFRPFPPQITPDSRAALFSTPYFCAAIDLWSLPGWNALESANAEVLIAFNRKSRIRLAAAPIPLTIQPWPHNQAAAGSLKLDLQPNRIGLLLQHNNGTYWWCTLSLNRFLAIESAPAEGRKQVEDCIKKAVSGKSDPPTDSSMPDTNTGGTAPWCIPLSIKGRAVQVNWFDDQKIVFSSPLGHWIWSPDDAATGTVQLSETIDPEDGSSRTRGLWELPEPDNLEIDLDDPVVDRSHFSFLRQSVFATSRGESRKFEIAYTVERNIRTRSVWPDRHRKTISCSPVELESGCRALMSRTTSNSKNNELLMVLRDDGAIYRRKHGHTDVAALDIRIGDFTEVAGLQYRNPLLIVVRKEASDTADRFTVQLRSLRYPTDIAVVNGLLLQADPIAWSNFLFTCEAEASGIRIVRREFPIRSSGTNKHMNTRTRLGVLADQDSNDMVIPLTD
ncbi:MAG: hypothetical protein ABGZ35_25595 [Planctomycetaceae bacterium]